MKVLSNIISGKLHVVRRIYNWINDSPNDLKYPSSLLNKKYPMQLKVIIFINTKDGKLAKQYLQNKVGIEYQVGLVDPTKPIESFISREEN